MSEYLYMNDQPVTCPKCGCRTEFEDLISDEEVCQLHVCMNSVCLNAFKVIEDLEFEA